MRQHYKELVLSIFFLALLGNVTIFISSMKLSTEIHAFEQKTFALKQENTVLEKEMADAESFLYTKKFEMQWGFVRATKPTYMSDLPLAQR